MHQLVIIVTYYNVISKGFYKILMVLMLYSTIYIHFIKYKDTWPSHLYGLLKVKVEKENPKLNQILCLVIYLLRMIFI